MAEQKADKLQELTLECLTLLEALLLYFTFIIPAMIHEYAVQNDVQQRLNYVTFSILPRPSGLAEQLEIGEDIGLYVRNDLTGDVTHVFDSGATSVGWRVDWPSQPGPHFTSRFVAPIGTELKVGAWLRKIDPLRMSDPQYVQAISSPITIIAYGSRDAAEVQYAMRNGLPAVGALTLTLDPATGSQTESDFPQTLLEVP